MPHLYYRTRPEAVGLTPEKEAGWFGGKGVKPEHGRGAMPDARTQRALEDIGWNTEMAAELVKQIDARGVREDLEAIVEAPPAQEDVERALAKFNEKFDVAYRAVQAGDTTRAAELDQLNEFYTKHLAPYLPKKGPGKVVSRRGKSAEKPGFEAIAS